MEQELQFHREGTQLSARGRTRLRQGQGDRHPEVEGQPGRREAGEVPRLWQRRERLLRQRRAVHRQCRPIEGAKAGIPGELHRRNGGHGTAGFGQRGDVARRQQDLLPRGGGGRQGQAERAVVLCRCAPSGDLQQAGATGQGGRRYRGQVSANRSLGDLRKSRPEVPNFWDIEHPKYALMKGPNWLKIDADTGALSGTPDAAGKAEVEVTATIEQEVRKLDEGTLGWGQEKVVSTSTEKVGSASQQFVIEVSP